MDLSQTDVAPESDLDCSVVLTIDDDVNDAVLSSTAQLNNRSPIISSISLLPEDAYSNQTATCSVEVEDADNKSDLYTKKYYIYIYVYTNGSTTITSNENSTSNTDEIVINRDSSPFASNLDCSVVVSDGHATDSEAQNQTTITIANAPLSLSSTTDTFVELQLSDGSTGSINTQSELRCQTTQSGLLDADIQDDEISIEDLAAFSTMEYQWFKTPAAGSESQHYQDPTSPILSTFTMQRRQMNLGDVSFPIKTSMTQMSLYR